MARSGELSISSYDRAAADLICSPMQPSTRLWRFTPSQTPREVHSRLSGIAHGPWLARLSSHACVSI
jgi:hypothetical protein